jgi:hypothetical protein
VTQRDTSASGDVGLAALAASRASRVELGIAALRGGSTGAVLSNAAGLVLFHAVVPVMLPITALLAAFLGRMTFRSARTAQVRGLRAEAERAVGMYLEEVDSRARRDTRDSVRRIHQHIRDVFSGNAAELQSSMQRNLEVLAQGVRDDQRDRELRLKQVDAELARLRSLAARAERMVDELLGAAAR